VNLVSSFWTWDGWPALVSIGTLLLAVSTGLLALITRRAVGVSKDELKILEAQTTALQDEAHAVGEQVEAVRAQAEATKRQAELSAAAIEASARPILVGLPPDFSTEVENLVYTPGPTIGRIYRSQINYTESEDYVYCSVPLRNVGGGVAFVQSVSLLTGLASYEGRISNPVIPTSEIARVRFSLLLVDRSGKRTDANAITAADRGFPQFTVYLVYTGASRDLVTASKVTVAGLPDGAFLVTGNEILDGEAVQRLLASSANVG
jgi:hypothetical protein